MHTRFAIQGCKTFKSSVHSYFNHNYSVKCCDLSVPLCSVCQFSLQVMMIISSVLLLLSNAFLVSSQEELYIVPSSSNTCLGGAKCLTMSQFASRNTDIDYNITLNFYSGNHTLSSPLVFRTSVIMVNFNLSEHDCVRPVVMTCTHAGSISFSNSPSAIIHSIGYRSCHLQMFDSQVSIVNSTFYYSFHRQSQEAYLGYNWGHGEAGVIVSQRSSITLSQCIFERNRAQLGAAVFIVHSIAEIHNSSFLDNGAICTGTRICLGGVLYSYNSTITIKLSKFWNNSASHKASHGGVFALFDSSASIYDSYFAFNTATHGSGGVVYAQRTNVNITSSLYFNNTAAQRGGVIRSAGSTVLDIDIFIMKTNFTNNMAMSGSGAIDATESCNINVWESIFSSNKGNHGGTLYVKDIRFEVVMKFCVFISSSAKFGGVILAYQESTIVFENCFFSNNSASLGGVIYARVGNIILFEKCLFLNNSALVGGVIHVIQLNTIVVENCLFSSNSASKAGGVLSHRGVEALFPNSTIINCTFEGNSAMEGGVVLANNALVYFMANCTFEGNSATEGAVVYAIHCARVYLHSVFLSNNVANLGLLYLIESTGLVSGYSRFSTNTPSLFAYNSNLTIIGDTIFSNFSQSTNCTIVSEGGAITAFQSKIVLGGFCFFEKNLATSGGAVYATESQVYITGNTTLSNNTAKGSGGGVYLYRSALECKGNSKLSLLGNVAGEKGGAIHAISSSIKTSLLRGAPFSERSQIIFTGNSADRGGALALEVNSKLYIFIKVDSDPNRSVSASLTFIRNRANYGGAIYVADDTNSGICSSSSFYVQSSSTECFLQSLSLRGKFLANYTYINFTDNTGETSGDALFGGLLDRCTVSPFSQVYSRSIPQYQEQTSTIISGLTYFETYSNIKLKSISSEPIRICFCSDHHHDCDYQPPTIRRKKGERFEIALVAVDQVGNPLNNVNVLTSLSSNLGGLGVNQSNQTTEKGCTSLHYEAFSPHLIEQLKIHAVGPCGDSALSQRTVQINFTACKCPLGFQPKPFDKTNCVCECDPKLFMYIQSCDLKTSSFIRKGNPWISYVTDSDNSSSGYLIYAHCPLDYCFPPGSDIPINVNMPNGSDAQCEHKRSGLLCGKCRPELSLSLGTNRCVSCPEYWPALLVLQAIGFLVAGLALVTVLMMLNMTVAVGTINGIIFYANILYSFAPSFIPHTRVTFSSVFLSWLNLESGFNFCLFKGMDAYWKTWIELLFPTYVIFLVVMIIVVSEWSGRFSHLIGKGNPVATLATLVLFSYAKLLSIIIKVLSFAIITYPRLNGSAKVLRWLPDASLSFFRGRHVPLGIVALVLLLFCMVFTFFVFSRQWLVCFDDNKLFKLFKWQKISLFIETYHAPYTPRNRYWTGLLLIVRVALYVASSINVSGNPNVNLLVIGLVMIGVLFLKEITGISTQIYKEWPVEIFELSIYINITVLCISTIFANIIEDERAKVASVNVSVSIVFLQLSGIIFYHFFREIVSKTTVWKKCTEKTSRAKFTQEESNVSDKLSSTTPTSSVVDKPERPLQLLGTRTGLGSELQEPLLVLCDSTYH